MQGSKPLYVRLPEAEADRLSAVAASTGKSKRQLVGDAVKAHLDDDRLTVGRIALREPDADVMTLPEVAAFLRIGEEQARQSAERGELPGRLIGSEWRFARTAVLAWLSP
jgi:excisionase family DNA binding protein